MKKPAALRNILLVADPFTAGMPLLRRMETSGFAIFRLENDSEELLNAIQEHLAANEGRPLAVLVETGGTSQLVTSAVRDLQHALATPVCVHITRQDRALQTVLELEDTKYNYAAFRKYLLSNSKTQAKVAAALPKGKNAPLTELTNEALRKNWKLELRRLASFLGISLATGEEGTGLEYETASALALADRFRGELSNNGRPGGAVQPALGTNAGRHAYGEKTGSSAELKHGEKLRAPRVTAEQSEALRQAKANAATRKASKGRAGGGGGGGGRRNDNPAKGPVMGERTRAAKSKPEVVARPVGREEGMNNARQVSRRPVGENAATATATKEAAKAAKALPGKKAAAPKTYWDGRKSMSYYGRAVELARLYAPKAKSLLDVGGRDCLYSLEVPAEKRVTLDPDRGPSNPGIHWVQSGLMEWQPDQIYDVAFCLQVLEHIPDSAAFLKKLLQVARVVVVSVPFNWPPTDDHTHHHLKTDVFEKWSGRKPDHLEKIKEDGRPPSYSKRVMAVYVQNFAPPSAPAPPAPAPAAVHTPAQTSPAPQNGASTPAPAASTPPAPKVQEELAPAPDQQAPAPGSEASAENPASGTVPQIQIQRDDPHPF